MKLKAVKIAFIAIIIFISPAAALAATPTNEPAPTAAEVLVVYNSSYTTDSNSDTVQDSLEIANYYKDKRSIPAANVLGIAAPVTEVITRTQYNNEIKPAIESYLTSSGLKTTIKYIVLIKGIPLKILVTNGTEFSYGVTDNSSVDAAVALLFETYSIVWRLTNPYYNADPSITKNYRFKTEHFSQSGVYLRYLVTRLDGYTVADVEGMIDRGFAPDTTGTGYWVIDADPAWAAFTSGMQNAWNKLNSLFQNLNPNPFSNTSTFLTTSPGPVMGYTSFGRHAGMGDGYVSNSPVNPNHLDFTLLPGAVFSTYESFNALNFTDKTQTDHGQVAEWIEIGGSGGIGNVYEPWASGIAHEEIFMPLYAAGYPWADAAYQSLVYTDFVTVVVGDPLMTIVETTPPGEITNLQSDAGDNQVSLSWTNPADADFAGLKILRKTGSYPTNSADGDQIYNSNGTSHNDSFGVVNGTTYFYTAFAYDEVPNYSPGTSAGARTTAMPTTGPDTTPPAEVTNMQSIAGDTQVSLSWTNPADADFTGVKILRKTGSYPTNISDGTLIYDSTGTSYTDTNGGLVNGTAYFYAAFAYDEVPNYSPGTASGARTTATPAIPPPDIGDVIPPNKPTDFNATAGNGQVSLSWTNPNASDFAGIRILRRTDYYPISPTNGTLVYKGTGTSYTNTGLTNGTTYFYTILAFDRVNNFSVVDYTINATATPYSGSPITNATPGDSPSTAFTEPNITTQGYVSGMSAIVSSGQISISWMDPFNDINWKGTRLVRKVGSYPTSPTDGKIIFNGTTSAYTDTSVSPGTTYYYAAFAYNDWRNYSDGTISGAKTSALAQ